VSKEKRRDVWWFVIVGLAVLFAGIGIYAYQHGQLHDCDDVESW
jgi:hypothetical protein